MGASNATAAVRAKKLPIVIVPGVMGTRLVDPATGSLVWNPTADRGIFAANDGRMKDVSRPLEPDERNGFPVHDARFIQVLDIRHINNIIFDFYGALAVAMQHDLRRRLAKKNVVPVVYCCGYDFRVDNALSAQRLDKVVKQALAECDGEPAIIIAHSMGGLITRHFCKNLGGEPNVRSIVLLASPSLGAPDAYFTLRTGLDELFPVRLILFQSLDGSRKFSRGLPSVYQLLPGILYGTVDPGWVTFDPKQTGFSRTPPAVQDGPRFADASQNFFVFNDIYTGLADDLAFRTLSDQFVLAARNFDAGLLQPGGSATYLHPSTFVVAGTGTPSPGRAQVLFDGVATLGAQVAVSSRVVANGTVDGDKTVPLISANPAPVQPQPVDRRLFSGVEHQKVPATRSVIDHVINSIDGLF